VLILSRVWGMHNKGKSRTMRGHIRKRGTKWAVVVDVRRGENRRRKQRAAIDVTVEDSSDGASFANLPTVADSAERKDKEGR